MAINTYATLKSSIIEWSKRDDIASLVDDFIDLAEADMWQRLRIRDMEQTATGSLSARTLALPSGFQQMRRLYITSGGETYQLQNVAPESLQIKSGNGIPTQFCVTSQIEFNQTPATTYTYTIDYFGSLTALSDSNTSNAVLTRFPKVYLYGALMNCMQWAMIDDRAATYGALYAEAIDKANANDRKGRHGPAPLASPGRATP